MLAPLVLLAAYAGTLELLDSSEARARSTTGQGAGAPAIGFDLSTQPQLRTRVTDRRWDWSFSYMPSLTVPDIEQGLSLQVLHTATLGVGWHDRLVRIALAADATVGTFNSAYLAAPTPTGQSMAGLSSTTSLQLAAQPGAISVLTTHPTAVIGIRADRRTSFSLDAGYMRSGGLDSASQQQLPKQEGAMADASASYALSRKDQVVSLVHGQEAAFGALDCSVYTRNPANTGEICAPQGQLLQFSEGLAHSFGRTTHLTLTAGFGLAWSRLQSSAPYHGVVLPGGGVSFDTNLGRSSNMQLGVQLLPWFDPLTGVLRNQGQLQGTVTETLDKVFALNFTVSALQGLPTTDPLAATLVAEGVELRIRASDRLRLAVGQRVGWQSEGGVNFLSAIGYFDVTVLAPKLRY